MKEQINELAEIIKKTGFPLSEAESEILADVIYMHYFPKNAEYRAEAIKEFAERLKAQCSSETTDNVNNPCVRILYDAEEAIDDLVKEMEEE